MEEIKELARKAFTVALRFDKATMQLSTIMVTKGMDLVVPIIANSAFTLELYLKTISMLTLGTNPARIHNLHDLFNSLPESEKIIIDKYYHLYMSTFDKELIKYCSENKVDIDIYSILLQSKNSYMEWRYAYEGKNRTQLGVHYISHGIRDRILELEPKWGDLLFPGTKILPKS